MNRTEVLDQLCAQVDGTAAPGAEFDLWAITEWVRDETVDKETVESLEDQLVTAKQWRATAIEEAQHARTMRTEALRDKAEVTEQNEHLQAALEAAAARHAELTDQIRLLRATVALECGRPYGS